MIFEIIINLSQYFIAIIHNILNSFSYSNDFMINNKSSKKYNHIFINQKMTWDCGLACCNMLLKWSLYDYHNAVIDNNKFKNELNQITELITFPNKNNPLWTIELFYLLKDYEDFIDIAMYTLYKGINPIHNSINWYSDSLQKDTEYIQEKFDHASLKHWKVYEVR